MAVSDIIKTLEADNSRLAKESVIKSAATLATIGDFEAQTFLRCAKLAYDPYSKWGVRKVDEVSGQTETDAHAWDSFFPLLDDLKHRSLTGNAARDAVKKVSTLFSDDDWNLLCRRVLIKDLRCGVTSTTLNKFVPDEFKIPLFGCQLAVDSKGRPKSMKGLKRLEFKLDGVRMLAIVTADGGVTLTSRNGKDLENFPQIAESIATVASKFTDRFPNGFVLDGEVMGESFQALMKQARRKRDVKTADMVYNVFDVIDLDAFGTGSWSATQAQRVDILAEFSDLLTESGNIAVSAGFTVDLDTPEGSTRLDEYFTEALELGYEGIMIKDVTAPYVTKRDEAWLKLKPALTVDLTVVGVEEGTGRNEGRLGALVCEGEDDGRLVRVNVGSGYSDGDREDFWTAQTDIIGQVVEVQADSITQAQDGSWSMRFPRFVRFRGFEAGEKM